MPLSRSHTDLPSYAPQNLYNTGEVLRDAEMAVPGLKGIFVFFCRLDHRVQPDCEAAGLTLGRGRFGICLFSFLLSLRLRSGGLKGAPAKFTLVPCLCEEIGIGLQLE